MATHTKHRSHARSIVRVPSIKPIVLKTTKIIKKAAKHSRRRSMGGLMSGLQTRQIVGGAALGFLKKTFPNLPHLPLVGQNGTVALAAMVLKGKVPFAEDVLNAALVVVGYQLGAGQTIDGEYVAGF
jgi:hypothetical protein